MTHIAPLAHLLRTTPRKLAAVGLLAVAVWPGAATAGGILVARFGGEHGHPTTDDVAAIYYNPAGMALATGTRLYLDGSFAHRSATYTRPAEAIDNPLAAGERRGGTPADGIAVNSGESTLSNLLASPFVGINSNLGVENLGVGVAFFTPFGGQQLWDQTQASARYPGAIDSPARWASIEGTIRSSYIAAGVAYRIPAAKLSLGVTGNLVLSSVDTIRARNANGTDDLETSTGALQEGRSYMNVSGKTGSIGAGVIWQPADNLWIGGSYQSKPGFGEMQLEGRLKQKLGALAPTDDGVEVHQTLPEVVRYGIRMRPTKDVELRLFGDYARWSAMKTQCLLSTSDANRKCGVEADGRIAAGASGVIVSIPRNWQDTYGLRAGGSYWVSPAVELLLGAGYDSNAVPSSTIDPALFDMDKATVSAGGRLKLAGEKLVLDATFTQVIYFTRTVAPRPNDGSQTLMPPSRQSDMAGKYEQQVSALVVGVGYTF
jgi:long-chain fatty acid transport protein